MEFEQEVMTLEEAIQHDGRRVWIQMMETQTALPVTYVAEHVPFLQFGNEMLYLKITVRGEYYGKTWRCFRKEPDRYDLSREWEEAENAD